MEKKMMAFQLLLMIATLHFCMAEVYMSSHADSSNVEISQNLKDSEVVKGPNRRLLRFLDCGAKCKVRCSLHSRPKICMRACGTCCSRCKCVPPGTHGNRHMCGRCYTHMITHGNKLKCP